LGGRAGSAAAGAASAPAIIDATARKIVDVFMLMN